MISGPSHPTPSRSHRSSSSLSTRSANTAATTASGLSGSTVGTTGGVAGSTISGIAPARDGNPVPRSSNARDSLSRNGSITSRRSEASSPSLASSFHQGDHFPSSYPHRLSNPPPSGQSTMSPSSNRSSYQHTARYEEAAHQRSELEIVRRENEALRQRVKELERSLNQQRSAAAPPADRIVSGSGEEVRVSENTVNITNRGDH